MRSSQRGVTLIGWIVLLVPLAIIVYAGIQLTPRYLTYMSVAKSLTQVANDYQDGTQISPQQVRSSIEKQFDINSINYPTAQEIDIHREGEGWVAVTDYDETVPLFANISLVVSFHKEVRLR